jgi:hypothetical protein
MAHIPFSKAKDPACGRVFDLLSIRFSTYMATQPENIIRHRRRRRKPMSGFISGMHGI